MLTVVITTSGTGSRLNNLTKYTNKSLVKVGDKYSICYIIESYPEDTKFVVTLGYYGSFVKDFLELAYPDKNFEFVWVDKFEGSGSSLGYSLLQAKNNLQKSFVFHCCDSIITSPIYFDETSNKMLVYANNDKDSYSGIFLKENCEFDVCLKGENINYAYIGVSYIKDYDIFWQVLENEYNKNTNNMSLSDINILKIMKKISKIDYMIVDDWYDTGNLVSYEKTSQMFLKKYNVLDKYDESLCFLKGSVIKFFYDKAMNLKRVKRGNDLYPLSPKLLGYRDNFMKMEYVVGEVLSEYNGYGEIYKLLCWANNYLWISPTIKDEFKVNCMNFYKEKTLDRIKKLKFITEELTTINNIHVGTITDLLKMVDFEFLSTDCFYKFHGDFILDNIIKNKDGYKVIDWRQEFDNQLYFGDKYYDLAKLRHNIYFNHNNILKKLYQVKIENSEVYIDMKCNFMLINQLDDYNKFINENNLNLNKIKLLTAIIWINMSPLYEGDLSLFLFYFGKFNLYLALQEHLP